MSAVSACCMDGVGVRGVGVVSGVGMDNGMGFYTKCVIITLFIGISI